MVVRFVPGAEHVDSNLRNTESITPRFFADGETESFVLFCFLTSCCLKWAPGVEIRRGPSGGGDGPVEGQWWAGTELGTGVMMKEGQGRLQPHHRC